MKITNSMIENKNYYDEFLFIIKNYKKIKKNPATKVYRLTFYIIFYEFVILILILITFYFYSTSNHKNNLFLIIFNIYFFSTFLFNFKNLIVIKKCIKRFANTADKRTANITNKYIEYFDSENDLHFKMEWKNIQYMIINKYSICFIPKIEKDYLFSVSIDNKEKLIALLRKYKLDSLIVDNSDLYEED